MVDSASSAVRMDWLFISKARWVLINSMSSRVGSTLLDSSMFWRMPPRLSSRGLPSWGVPLATVSAKRLAPNCLSPAGLMKLASSSWPTSVRFSLPGRRTWTRPSAETWMGRMAFSGMLMVGSRRRPSLLASTISPSALRAKLPARVYATPPGAMLSSTETLKKPSPSMKKSRSLPVVMGAPCAKLTWVPLTFTPRPT